MDISSIVASGMQAMRTKHAAHAHNVANAQTPGYRRLTTSTTERSQGGVDLSVERASSPESTSGRGELPSVSADDGSSAGSASSLDDALASAAGTPEANGLPPTEAGASSRTDESVTSVAGADLVSDMVGMNEAARGMEMLAAVYQSHDETLGTMLDTFG